MATASNVVPKVARSTHLRYFLTQKVATASNVVPKVALGVGLLEGQEVLVVATASNVVPKVALEHTMHNFVCVVCGNSF